MRKFQVAGLLNEVYREIEDMNNAFGRFNGTGILLLDTATLTKKNFTLTDYL